MEHLSSALVDLREVVLALDADGGPEIEKAGARARSLEARLGALPLGPPDTDDGLARTLDETRATLEVVAAEAEARSREDERWNELSREAAARYDALRSALEARGLRDVVRNTPRRITRHNPSRSAFHAAGGIAAAFSYRYLVDFGGALAIAVSASILGIVLEVLRRRVGAFNAWFMHLGFVKKVARPDEHRRIWSSTYFAWGVTAAVVLCSPLAVQVGCVVLAIGDPAASMVGRAAGGPKLLEAKSVGGSLAFLVFGGLAAWGFLAGTSPLPLVEAAQIAFFAAFIGAIAELLSRQVDDNLTIPIAASLAAEALL